MYGDTVIRDVRNDPQQAALIERARLFRDVRRRIVQTQKRLHMLDFVFGDDLARSVLQELIDHDAVEPGQHTDLPGRQTAETGYVLRPDDAVDHGSNETDRVHVVAPGIALGFQHDRLSRQMDRKVEKLARLVQIDSKDALYGILMTQHLKSSTNVMNGLSGKKIADFAPDRIRMRQ